MCSLARFYYSGNPERKSTAITAKLFVFLIDIFSEIHKSLAFDAVSGSKASACPASARLCRRHVRQGSASQSQYIYLQAKHSVLADGCALRVSGGDRRPGLRLRRFLIPVDAPLHQLRGSQAVRARLQIPVVEFVLAGNA